MPIKKQYFIPQNEEHIEKLCDDLLKWAKNTDIPIIADFMEKEMIPWSILKNLIETNEEVEYSFQLAVTFLVVKWYHKAQQKEFPKAMLRLLSRYIEAYDQHLFYVDSKRRQIIADKVASMFEEKDWSKEVIPEPFKNMYDQNKG